MLRFELLLVLLPDLLLEVILFELPPYEPLDEGHPEAVFISPFGHSAGQLFRFVTTSPPPRPLGCAGQILFGLWQG